MNKCIKERQPNKYQDNSLLVYSFVSQSAAYRTYHQNIYSNNSQLVQSFASPHSASRTYHQNKYQDNSQLVLEFSLSALLLPKLTTNFTEFREQVLFSMAIENVDQMHECCWVFIFANWNIMNKTGQRYGRRRHSEKSEYGKKNSGHEIKEYQRATFTLGGYYQKH